MFKSLKPLRVSWPADRQHGLLADEGGAVYVEHIVLTLLVAIGFSAAVIAIGVPMLESFRMTQIFLALPLP